MLRIKTNMPISIHALRVEGDIPFLQCLPQIRISIHALRVEGDASGATAGSGADDFNPRPPRGGRQYSLLTAILLYAFQSTPSAWRATTKIAELESQDEFQSTPSAWRATPAEHWRATYARISIHALRVEGDI